MKINDKIQEKGALLYGENGVQYAGIHLFVDMWGAKSTDQERGIVASINRAVDHSGATLLKIDSSSFGEHAGITSFAILAESHICVNTWHVEQMVAIDIFFCAGKDPYLCLPSFQDFFAPTRMELREHKRLMASPLTHEESLL